jgi:hypothetical protein
MRCRRKNAIGQRRTSQAIALRSSIGIPNAKVGDHEDVHFPFRCIGSCGTFSQLQFAQTNRQTELLSGGLRRTSFIREPMSRMK